MKTEDQSLLIFLGLMALYGLVKTISTIISEISLTALEVAILLIVIGLIVVYIKLVWSLKSYDS